MRAPWAPADSLSAASATRPSASRSTRPAARASSGCPTDSSACRSTAQLYATLPLVRIADPEFGKTRRIEADSLRVSRCRSARPPRSCARHVARSRSRATRSGSGTSLAELPASRATLTGRYTIESGDLQIARQGDAGDARRRALPLPTLPDGTATSDFAVSLGTLAQGLPVRRARPDDGQHDGARSRRDGAERQRRHRAGYLRLDGGRVPGAAHPAHRAVLPDGRVPAPGRARRPRDGRRYARRAATGRRRRVRRAAHGPEPRHRARRDRQPRAASSAHAGSSCSSRPCRSTSRGSRCRAARARHDHRVGDARRRDRHAPDRRAHGPHASRPRHALAHHGPRGRRARRRRAAHARARPTDARGRSGTAARRRPPSHRIGGPAPRDALVRRRHHRAAAVARDDRPLRAGGRAARHGDRPAAHHRHDREPARRVVAAAQRRRRRHRARHARSGAARSATTCR